MSIKEINLDDVSQKQKNVFIGGFLSVWLLATIYFQDIVNFLV